MDDTVVIVIDSRVDKVDNKVNRAGKTNPNNSSLHGVETEINQTGRASRVNHTNQTRPNHSASITCTRKNQNP